MEILCNFYMDCGYLCFNVDLIQVVMLFEKDGIYILFNIIEGEQYIILDVELVGDLLGYEDFIEKVLLLILGEFYSQVEVMYIEEYISKYFGCFGYVYFIVIIVFEINDEDKIVKLMLWVDFGKCIYVCCINFNGNIIIVDEVLC